MKQEKYKTAKIKGYIDLTKPSILLMVLITTLLGYYLGSDGISSWFKLFWTLLGTGLSAGGAGALNQYLEREQDCLMERTRDRPIPAGLIQPQDALLFGLILVLTGSVLLVWRVNLLTGFLSLLTTFMYVLIYTPMKRITWLNTSLGSIPGALPPIGGNAPGIDPSDVFNHVNFFIGV